MERYARAWQLLDQVQQVVLAIDCARAADAVNTGAMIALIPTDADAGRLALAGGVPGDQLHATLQYLGNGGDYSQGTREHLVDLVRGYFHGAEQVDAEAFAVNVFNPTSPERPTCLVLGLSGAGLADAYRRACGAVDDYGADVPEQHQPWQAHLALAYTDDLTRVPECVERCGPLTFDRVRVAFAGEHTDIPLI